MFYESETNMVIVGIHQPNYAPWLGYFHKIMSVNTFILLDDVQIPGGSLANRNYIKGKDGFKVRLSVPIRKTQGVKSSYIEATPDYSQNWGREHLNKITDAYRKAPYFDSIFTTLGVILLKKYDTLSNLNTSLIKWVCASLEINTNIVMASDLNLLPTSKNERNIALCKHFDATIYLSGTGARKYNNESLFRTNNIVLQYQNFVEKPHLQGGTEFVSGLSVLDALFYLAPSSIRGLMH